MLQEGGRLCGYVIHTPPHLNGEQVAKAREMGPAAGVLEGPAVDLLAEAGFRLIQQTDVTPEFELLLAAIRAHRTTREADLRAEEGDQVFEEGQERKRLTLQCVREGLLIRTLWVAERLP